LKCGNIYGRISSLFLPLTTTTRGDFLKDHFLAVKKVKPGIFALFFALMLQIAVFGACQVFCARVKKKNYLAGGKFFIASCIRTTMFSEGCWRS